MLRTKRETILVAWPTGEKTQRLESSRSVLFRSQGVQNRLQHLLKGQPPREILSRLVWGWTRSSAFRQAPGDAAAGGPGSLYAARPTPTALAVRVGRGSSPPYSHGCRLQTGVPQPRWGWAASWGFQTFPTLHMLTPGSGLSRLPIPESLLGLSRKRLIPSSAVALGPQPSW